MFLSKRKQIEDWKQNLHKYEEQRKKLPWSHPPKIDMVSHYEIKAAESAFNPIIQNPISLSSEIVEKVPISYLKGMKKRQLQIIQKMNEEIFNLSDKPSSKIQNIHSNPSLSNSPKLVKPKFQNNLDIDNYDLKFIDNVN